MKHLDTEILTFVVLLLYTNKKLYTGNIDRVRYLQTILEY